MVRVSTLGNIQKKALHPERATDHVGQMHAECYRKGIGYLLGSDTSSVG
jgi:hypothetical protein